MPVGHAKNPRMQKRCTFKGDHLALCAPYKGRLANIGSSHDVNVPAPPLYAHGLRNLSDTLPCTLQQGSTQVVPDLPRCSAMMQSTAASLSGP